MNRPAMRGAIAAGSVALLLLCVSSGCSSNAGTSVTAPSSSTTPITAQVTTLAADVSLPAAAAVDLSLPGVSAEIDIRSCTLDASLEEGILQFAKNSATLPGSGPGRDALLKVLDLFRTAQTIQVTGHTSTEGTRVRNDELSRQRAEAVAAVGRVHLPRVTFVTQGVGSTSTTVVEDGTETSRAPNRRVQLTAIVEREDCDHAGPPTTVGTGGMGD